MSKTVVLEPKKVKQIIQRIAYQLYEDFITEDDIVMAGIEENGALFANLLSTELNKLSTKNNTVLLCSVNINKENPLESDIKLSINEDDYKNKNIIIVDDVLNSGKTLMYTASKFMESGIKSMRTVTLIDRRHRKFPIKADYVGLTLSTTVQEHIEVEFDNDNINAYLM